MAMNFRTILQLIALSVPLWAAAADADEIPEYKLKSDFIYNFAGFVKWPNAVGKSLMLCIAAPQSVLEQFASLDGKPVGTRTLSIRHLDHGASPKGCDLVFVSEAESDTLDAWLFELWTLDSTALTITESEAGVKAGAMVGLLVEGQRVVFVVNTDAAKAVGISINSRLLRLARKIYDGRGGDEDAK